MFLLPYALVLLFYGAAFVIRRKRWVTGVDIPAIDSSSFSSLAKARGLQAPEVTSTRGGELEHLDFWNTHYQLIQRAWHEWERDIRQKQNDDEHRAEQMEDSLETSWNDRLPSLAEGVMMEPLLKESIRKLWNKPSLEAELEMQAVFWEEPIRNVYTCASFFSSQGIRHLQQHLTLMRQAGIPTRRPNGMNRNGFVLDDETEGGVSYVSVDEFRGWLVDDYLRPLGRMFFPEYIGSDEDDESSYAFTVHYQYDDGCSSTHTNDTPGENNTSTVAVGSTNTTATRKRDVKLKEHSDASVVTININLNLPGEAEYDGSQLLFLDEDPAGSSPEQAQRHKLEFQPGMAVIHRGLHRHQALPIEKGERHQLIIWLFGKDGYVRVSPYEPKDQLAVKKRWSKSKTGGRNRKHMGGDSFPFEL
ncbi:MAG: hypothetical protein SGBAC_012668 [Bacillariaceae sp.]